MESNKNIAEKLNELLATYQIHYQNIRALHWNIKGSNFFELHLKYEELYTRAQEIIDELAERILTLQTSPVHRYSDYLRISRLSENETISDGQTGMKYVLDAQRTILELEKELLKLTGEADDEGTNALISDLVREKEKTNWMFAAWLQTK